MKKIVMLLLVSVLLVLGVSADDISPKIETSSLLMQFQLEYRFDPHFIFSDISDMKDGSFENIFETGSLNKVNLDYLVDGKLYSKGKLYVYWLNQDLMPIERLTIEMPTPLLKDDDFLDWYVSVDGNKVIGGKNGYGAENATVIYERSLDASLHGNEVDSVQLDLWTDDINGKKAGEYNGSLILRVFGES